VTISKDVWVFGDYRNYFQNRITLQLLSKGKELAKNLGGHICALLLGSDIIEYAMEYIAHGAEVVYAVEHPDLSEYQVETYTQITADLVRRYQPEVFLLGATSFGREFAPRLAARLATGLSADCLSLEIDSETGNLLQTTPAFAGNLMALIVTPHRRPQMATVHPGVFKEKVHDHTAMGRIIYPEVEVELDTRVELIRSRQRVPRKIDLENAHIVVVGGRGMESRTGFHLLFEFAELLNGQVGATRPAVLAGWTEEERLIGQTGKTIKPKLLLTCGTSGALQYTAGIMGSEVVIAINKDPHAPIFRYCDLGLVGDVKAILPLLIETLKKRV
jgi:electron transfer flavoprotein alpha subunit